MRMKLTAVLILALVSSAVVQAQEGTTAQPTPKPIKKPGYFNRARFETKYDKFKDTTTVQFKRLPLTGTSRRVLSGETLYFIGAFHFKGQVIAMPVSVAQIGFLSESEDWLYLRDSHLTALIDGERVDLGIANRDSNVGKEKVNELLIFEVSYETLLKIANGATVEMQLGPREFKLKDSHLYALRDLAARMKPNP